MKKRRQKIRLDQLLKRQRPGLSRSRIQAEIMAGKVLLEGSVCDKPGTLVDENAAVKILEPENRYVSRGGLKLDKALSDFSLDVRDLVVLDAGASTGGFTDCLLQNGARLVYALDVGYGQLDYRLRHHPAVKVMERFNVRFLKPGDLPDIPDLAVVDLSFISLTKVVPVLHRLRIPGVLALVKPQFEVGRADAGRGKGVIRDPGLHQQVLRKVIDHASEHGYCCRDMTFSRYPGPKGNIEYFILLSRPQDASCSCPPEYDKKVTGTVEKAHLFFAAGKD